MKRGFRLGFIHGGFVVLGLALASCATPTSRTNTSAAFEWTSPTKRILLAAPDIQLSLLDAGGVLEPRADWSETARSLIEKGMRELFNKSGAELINVEDPSPREVQLMKLHNAVGIAILTHLYAPSGGGNALPNKGSALDWTLGPGTTEMREHYGADYALFVFVR